jgi:hypothetical protein
MENKNVPAQPLVAATEGQSKRSPSLAFARYQLGHHASRENCQCEPCIWAKLIVIAAEEAESPDFKGIAEGMVEAWILPVNLVSTLELSLRRLHWEWTVARAALAESQQQADDESYLIGCEHGVQPESDCLKCHPSLLRFATDPPAAPPAVEGNMDTLRRCLRVAKQTIDGWAQTEDGRVIVHQDVNAAIVNLPAHDAEVRREALEEAAKMFDKSAGELRFSQTELQRTDDLRAMAAGVRALAAQSTPAPKEQR